MHVRNGERVVDLVRASCDAPPQLGRWRSLMRSPRALAPSSSSSNPSQDVDGQDAIVAHVNEVIVSLIQPAVERRPSAMATNRKFARFIRALLEPEDDDI